jgi:hypothetical protein
MEKNGNGEKTNHGFVVSDGDEVSYQKYLLLKIKN